MYSKMPHCTYECEKMIILLLAPHLRHDCRCRSRCRIRRCLNHTHTRTQTLLSAIWTLSWGWQCCWPRTTKEINGKYFLETSRWRTKISKTNVKWEENPITHTLHTHAQTLAYIHRLKTKLTYTKRRCYFREQQNRNKTTE